MTQRFDKPFILFYPVVSRTGATIPVNKAIKEIRGEGFVEEDAWRGNIIAAKYRGGGTNPFMSLMDMSMADFPLLKNHLMNRGPSGQVRFRPVAVQDVSDSS